MEIIELMGAECVRRELDSCIAAEKAKDRTGHEGCVLAYYMATARLYEEIKNILEKSSRRNKGGVTSSDKR